jgi:hypothetical protein
MDALDDIDDLTPLIDSQVEECLSGQSDSYFLITHLKCFSLFPNRKQKV